MHTRKADDIHGFELTARVCSVRRVSTVVKGG